MFPLAAPYSFAFMTCVPGLVFANQIRILQWNLQQDCDSSLVNRLPLRGKPFPLLLQSTAYAGM